MIKPVHRAVTKPNQSLSIIIPVLNEADRIGPLLKHLRANVAGADIIVVDGGSTDNTCSIAQQFARVVTAAKGRGLQANAGAVAATGDVFWFLHADTRPHPDSAAIILRTLKDSRIIAGGFEYGFFEQSRLLDFFAWYSNRKNRVTRRLYGDMGIFVRRKTFEQLGGFPQLKLMEDFEFGRRLARHGKIAILPQRILTSARDWQREGIVRKIFKDFLVRMAYRFKASDDRLYQWYYGERHDIA